MLLAFGAASTAVDALKALTSSKSSAAPSKGFSQGSTDPFEIASDASAAASAGPAANTGGGAQISPATMSALLAAQSQLSSATTSAPTFRSEALQDLFSQIDGNGAGQISKPEFELALGAGGTNIAQADAVFGKLQALQAATATSLTNSDCSTTTSLSTGDGSKVTMTLPSAASASSAATSSYNLIEQLIQREAQAISFRATTPSFSLSA